MHPKQPHTIPRLYQEDAFLAHGDDIGFSAMSLKGTHVFTSAKSSMEVEFQIACCCHTGGKNDRICATSGPAISSVDLGLLAGEQGFTKHVQRLWFVKLHIEIRDRG
jgi:hypothetical protein